MQRAPSAVSSSSAKAGCSRRAPSSSSLFRGARPVVVSAGAASSSSTPSPPMTSTVDRLELLVPSRPPAQAQARAPPRSQVQRQEQHEQQQEQQEQQQEQQQRQRECGRPSRAAQAEDWLGRPLLPPDADPHTGGSELDVVLMAASLAALVFLSMEMYRLFAFVAFSPGFAAWRETFF